MPTQLTPCPTCRRHVGVSEARCPFCDARFEAPLAARETSPTVSRVIAMVAAAGVAGTLAVEGCGSGTAVYGAPDTSGTGGGSTSSSATSSSTSSGATSSAASGGGQGGGTGGQGGGTGGHGGG